MTDADKEAQRQAQQRETARQAETARLDAEARVDAVLEFFRKKPWEPDSKKENG